MSRHFVTLSYRGNEVLFRLRETATFGRRTDAVTPDVFSDASFISRKHGKFEIKNDRCVYTDLRSANGTLLNGTPCATDTPYPLSDGDELTIHPRDEATADADVRLAYRLEAPKTLSIHIKKRSVFVGGKERILLEDIRLDVPPRSMALILGGSGAGKTTFMNAVMGYEKAEGIIRYGDKDIYTQYEQVRSEIGFVPQNDTMRSKDRVYDTLMDAAKQRLAGGIPQDVLHARVMQTLTLFGLEAETYNLVEKLSGGQRKRLSIAMEYIGEPSLFFLDEPDSGIGGDSAAVIWKSLRTVADLDNIVIAISHSPDRAFDLFDRVIVLAKNKADNIGRLTFYGSPREACAHFQTDKLDDIVGRIS